jgi:hypothetical protein
MLGRCGKRTSVLRGSRPGSADMAAKRRVAARKIQKMRMGSKRWCVASCCQPAKRDREGWSEGVW